MASCNHTNQLQRLRRTFWQKMLGVKEVYVCKHCGQIVKIK
ncbi:hypothetical protein VFA_000583 [Vibrio furnissii CIP 102972]|nr:hypothetical protein vfu_A00418 [Vibrio furnissii NCTC 11218]EEX42616.1 hypothetical protein VFA_000583 [Vibrio furnissii CIP 102972]